MYDAPEMGRGGRAPMRVYVYKLVHDTGFAPNPFHDDTTWKQRSRCG
jgi:hypothetical protein